jgi:photosystem II stability/assembly factor-like uncharacterized protein
VDPNRPSTIYAGAYSVDYGSGLFRSVDGGASWIRIADIVPFALAIDPRPPSTVYAGGYRSVDGGSTWTATALATSFVLSLTVDAASGAVYAGTLNGEVLRSLDRGATWSPVGESLEGFGIVSLAVDPSGAALYAGTYSAGAFRLAFEEEPVRPRTRVVPRRRP